jgi:uncharacterized OsmC-like protein
VIILDKPIELTNITIIQDDTPNKIRRAFIGDFKEPVYYGVHGGVKEFYGVEPEIEYPSTLDHIVAAAGGWLVGTLSGALEARKIPTSPNKVRAQIQGIIEAPEGVLKITRISCHYEIKVPKGKRDAAERVLSVFERGCPVAQTLKGCIQFDHSWDIEEENE